MSNSIYFLYFFFISIFSILIIFYILRKNEIINETFFDTLFDIPTIRQKQEETNQHIFGNRLETCKSIPISTSQGLIMDSSIVCNATKQIKNPPTFYYEVYPEHCDKNAFFFVNLDLTDFRKLQQDPHSPRTILCKTHQTYDILSRLLTYKNVIYTGFTSVDKWMPNLSKNYQSYIHVAGKSEYKGTNHVIEAWVRHPEWPTLTLICRDEILETSKHLLKNKPLKNINLLQSYLSDNELNQLMNKNGIHICTSKHEGFGHYLNEARSLEAVVLYTNAAPMNEKFVDGVSGIAVFATNGIPTNNGICPTYNVSANTIEQSIQRTLKMSDMELVSIGKKARQDFLRDDYDFKQRLLSII